MPKSKTMCRGCRDDFYNRNREGGCWMYAKARIVERVPVGTWQPPPYERLPVKVLSCFHCTGTHYLELTDCRIKPKERKAKA